MARVSAVIEAAGVAAEVAVAATRSAPTGVVKPGRKAAAASAVTDAAVEADAEIARRRRPAVKSAWQRARSVLPAPSAPSAVIDPNATSSAARHLPKVAKAVAADRAAVGAIVRTA